MQIVQNIQIEIDIMIGRCGWQYFTEEKSLDDTTKYILK